MSERQHLDARSFEQLARSLFASSAAGVQVNGDSGTGKSVLLENVCLAALNSGTPFFLIDPHGTTAEKMKRLTLQLPKRVRDKVIFIKPSDLRFTVSINPLAIRREGISDFEYAARLSNKVGHTSSILLSTFGDDRFGFQTLMRKWVTRWLRTLAFAGLSLKDVEDLIDVSSPIYQRLIKVCPDAVGRSEMEEIADMNLSRREEQIASAKNRFLGLLENPVVAEILGKSDDSALDMQWAIENGYSFILDLSLGGVMSEDDQQIVANLYLPEFLHTVFNMPPERRRLYLCCIDELPVFQSSAPLLMRAMTEVRKFRVRFVVAHQGSNRFPSRTDNDFFRTIVSQLRTKFIFRHAAADAMFFGEEICLADYDPMRIKYKITQLQEYQDGHDVVTLTDESENWSRAEAEGGFRSQATSETETETMGTSSSTTDTDTAGQQATHTFSQSEGYKHTGDVLLQRMVNDARSTAAGSSSSQAVAAQQGTSQQTAKALGTTFTQQENWTRTSTGGAGRTYKKTLVPRIKTREVLSSVTFFTPEEIKTQAAATIAAQDTGEAILYVAGQFLLKVKLPLPVDRLERTPKTLARLEAEYLEELQGLPFFDTPKNVRRQREALRSALIARLDAAMSDLPRLGGAVDVPLLEEKVEDESLIGDGQPAEIPEGFPTDF